MTAEGDASSFTIAVAVADANDRVRMVDTLVDVATEVCDTMI